MTEPGPSSYAFLSSLFSLSAKTMMRLSNYVAGIFCVVFVFVFALLHDSSHFDLASRLPVSRRFGPISSSARVSVNCSHRQYVPSAWETQWVTEADDTAANDSICPTMQASADLSNQWLAGVEACKQDSATCWPVLPDRVFSKFVKECTHAGASGHGGGRVTVVEEHIEPLVGHMRHPLALQACVPPGKQAVDIQDRSYLLLLGDDHAAVRARHPGRAILVDAGTNTYESSLGYLIPAYAAAGIHFDAIYAWEATPADALQYWASVPDDVKPRLHFYNAPVTPQPGSTMNPVAWIRDMYRPGDYIVFKLDVDNDAVEGELIQQVLDMEGAEGMIAEMFFEKHYDAAELRPHFGSPRTKYPAALRLMHELRVKGVRVHYWP